MLSGCSSSPHIAGDAASKWTYQAPFELFWGDRPKLQAGQFPPNIQIIAIEGDGRPWLTPRKIAFDPTPASPLMLDWFNSTSHHAVYLGRPCYFGARQLQDRSVPVKITPRPSGVACDPYWYTFGRYSQPVVTSMQQALEAESGPCRVILGHSGGGTLAMLLAAELANVIGVVTLAGNLDVAAWLSHHRYSPLPGSLDPAARPPLASGIQQIHIAAEGDRTILAAWIQAETRRQGGEFLLWPVSSHNQWRSQWPRLDALLTTILANAPKTCSE